MEQFSICHSRLSNTWTHIVRSVISTTCSNPSGFRTFGSIVFSELYGISSHLSWHFNSSILQANTNHELFIVLFHNLLNNPPTHFGCMVYVFFRPCSLCDIWNRLTTVVSWHLKLASDVRSMTSELFHACMVVALSGNF